MSIPVRQTALEKYRDVSVNPTVRFYINHKSLVAPWTDNIVTGIISVEHYFGRFLLDGKLWCNVKKLPD